MLDKLEKIEMRFSIGAIDEKLIEIKPNDKICVINKKNHSINKEQIIKILEIIGMWKEKYYKQTINIDENEYEISIYYNGEIDIYQGKGEYPENYTKLIKILGEIENER